MSGAVKFRGNLSKMALAFGHVIVYLSNTIHSGFLSFSQEGNLWQKVKVTAKLGHFRLLGKHVNVVLTIWRFVSQQMLCKYQQKMKKAFAFPHSELRLTLPFKG
jgi:hypothetical protein